MDELRQKLLDLIATRGETLKSASLAVGKNHAYLHQYVHSGKPRRLPEDVRYRLARYLRVDEKDLRDDDASANNESRGFVYSHDIQASSGKDLPVLGRARMGADGFFFENGRVQELVERPPELSGARNAFAVYAVGSSMEPRYYEGELVFVNPAKPPAKGDFVVVELNDGGGYIKRLAGMTDVDVTLEQLNPHDLINIPLADVKSIFKIVGSRSR